MWHRTLLSLLLAVPCVWSAWRGATTYVWHNARIFPRDAAETTLSGYVFAANLIYAVWLNTTKDTLAPRISWYAVAAYVWAVFQHSYLNGYY